MIRVMGQLHLIDGVAHNDFKPDNLVIEERTNFIKAIDFAAMTSLQDNEKLL
jgi:serine/threonine protein kinase